MRLFVRTPPPIPPPPIRIISSDLRRHRQITDIRVADAPYKYTPHIPLAVMITPYIVKLTEC